MSLESQSGGVETRLPWPFHRTIGRVAYLCWGVGLMGLKHLVDWSVARFVFNTDWEPINYLIWPGSDHHATAEVSSADAHLGLTLLALAMPFISVGVVLTARRLMAARLPLWLVVLFFIPMVNLVFFAVLCVLPSARTSSEPQDELSESKPKSLGQRVATWHLQVTRGSIKRTMGLALLVTVPLMVLSVVLGAILLGSYGFGVFVGVPFTIGMISVLAMSVSREQGLNRCLAISMAAVTIAGLLFLAMGIEGIICMIMAVPMMAPLALFGGLFGFFIQKGIWDRVNLQPVIVLLVVLLPCLVAADAMTQGEPSLRVVRSEVVIAAAPETVWRNVIAFPQLPEPTGLLFQTGVAYPIRAEIRGEGVGAVRYCVFSTGAFVEPIEEWKAPMLLRFRVSDQPEPMREWSPYKIHPPHLHGYLVSRQGQFRIQTLPDGRTLLEGTTWYTNRMWPSAYWGLWSDYIIHQIHLRVLEHIRHLAEREKDTSR
jgi:hypothetical protein